MNESYPPDFNPAFLKTFLNLREDDGLLWEEGDLKPIWEAVLEAPLDQELRDSMPSAAEILDDLGNRVPHSFGECFLDPNPSVELLKLVKEFAKIQGARAEGLLPREVCLVLYYVCIHLTSRKNVSITELDKAAIQDAVQWVLKQNWVDAGTKRLLVIPEES